MKEIIIKGYTFSELNEEAKAKALESHNNILVEDEDYGWDAPLLEEFKEDMEAIGFADVKPAYSGFWSQGDGACFTCKSVDLVKVFKHMKSINYIDIPQSWIDAAKNGTATASIKKGGQSYAIVFAEDGLTAENIATVLTGYARQLSDKLYKDLEIQYDAETSKEAVGTELEEREYLFTKEGIKIDL